MTLRDLPPVRALAEERAREHYTMRMTIAGPAYGGIPWEQVSDYQRGLSEAAHLALLCDLTRPDSRDAVARLVADWIGWEHWQIGQAIADGGDDWILLCNTVGADWTTMETTPKDDLLGRIVLALFGREDRAKAIYNGWRDQPGWVPWVEGGNSHKQDEARRLAVLA